jgi:hypothetical protein
MHFELTFAVPCVLPNLESGMSARRLAVVVAVTAVTTCACTADVSIPTGRAAATSPPTSSAATTTSDEATAIDTAPTRQSATRIPAGRSPIPAAAPEPLAVAPIELPEAPPLVIGTSPPTTKPTKPPPTTTAKPPPTTTASKPSPDD